MCDMCDMCDMRGMCDMCDIPAIPPAVIGRGMGGWCGVAAAASGIAPRSAWMAVVALRVVHCWGVDDYQPDCRVHQLPAHIGLQH